MLEGSHLHLSDQALIHHCSLYNDGNNLLQIVHQQGGLVFDGRVECRQSETTILEISIAQHRN
jgi:hypothetical protein